MSRTLYIFNPEHDLALANNDANFNAPLSARQLASDLSCLPLWFADNNGIVWSSVSSLWLAEIQTLFPQLNSIFVTNNPDSAEISSVQPWGWDKAIVKRLTNINKDENSCDPIAGLCPNENQLAQIIRLSHRAMAVDALNFLRSCIESDLFPPPATILTDTTQVKQFTHAHQPLILKAPWSGSGKGLSWIRAGLTESHRGWCHNIIDKQGSVIAETAYDVLQDFALLFTCENGRCSFAGYSLFETEKGIYRSNILMSNEAIFSYLTQKYFQPELLATVQCHLQQFIESKIAAHYSGMLGVDMFAFRENDTVKLHPCVEINLRMTMGCVARIFYDKFVQQEAIGRFYIDHMSSKKALFANHNSKYHSMPLQIENGRIQSGYFSLTPVTEQSLYRVSIEIS